QQFAPTSMAGDRLQAGDTVKIVPKALIRGFVHAVTAPAARIVTAREQRELTWRQNQPGGYTQQRWLIEPAGNGTTLSRQTHVVVRQSAPLGIALDEQLNGDLGPVGAGMFEMAAPGPDLAQPPTIVAGGYVYLGSRLVTRLLA